MAGARVDGLRLQWVSVPWVAVWLVGRLTAIVHESELATDCDLCGRIAAAVGKCSVGRSVFGVSTDGDCARIDFAAVVTVARVDGLRLQWVSVQWVAVWLVSTDGDCA